MRVNKESDKQDDSSMKPSDSVDSEGFIGSAEQKIWFESYPTGIPHEINPNKYTSLSDFFEQMAQQYADRIAYVNSGVSLTYKECEQHSRHFANFLLHHLMLQKGDRVGIRVLEDGRKVRYFKSTNEEIEV